MDLRERVPNIMELKRQLGVGSYSKLHGILKGEFQPGVGLAIRIEQATAGAIHRWELRPDVWEAPPSDPAAA